jgi:hypothetical protein
MSSRLGDAPKITSVPLTTMQRHSLYSPRCYCFTSLVATQSYTTP